MLAACFGLGFWAWRILELNCDVAPFLTRPAFLQWAMKPRNGLVQVDFGATGFHAVGYLNKENEESISMSNRGLGALYIAKDIRSSRCASSGLWSRVQRALSMIKASQCPISAVILFVSVRDAIAAPHFVEYELEGWPRID